METIILILFTSSIVAQSIASLRDDQTGSVLAIASSGLLLVAAIMAAVTTHVVFGVAAVAASAKLGWDLDREENLRKQKAATAN